MADVPGLKSVPVNSADKPIASAHDVMSAIQEAIRSLCETKSVEALTIIGVLHTMAVFQRGQTCQQWQMEAMEQQIQHQMQSAMLDAITPEGGVQ